MTRRADRPLPAGSEPSHAILEQAAWWYARLRDGTHSARDREAWQVWLYAAEEHRAAWCYVEDVSRGFEPLRDMADSRAAAEALATANHRLHRRRRLLAGLAGLAGGGLLGALAWREHLLPASLMARAADHHTGKGMQRELALHDGSRVWLNTASAVNVDFDATARRVALVAGEVFIATAPDSSRPFLLRTVHGEMRALGTRFNVLLAANETRLAVFEGAVEIRTAARGASRVIPAGQQAHFSREHIAPAEVADIAREAWTQGTLVADNIPLREVIRELRRYRPGHLGLADEVAELTVYGSFPVRDTDRVLQMLASALPIRIEHSLPWWTSIEAKH